MMLRAQEGAWAQGTWRIRVRGLTASGRERGTGISDPTPHRHPQPPSHSPQKAYLGSSQLRAQCRKFRVRRSRASNGHQTSIPSMSSSWNCRLIFGMRWDPGSRRSKGHRATVWLFTAGSSHPISFSVSVESLAMNFCSRTVGLRPRGGEGFALPTSPGRQQSAKSPWSGCGGRERRRGVGGGRQASSCPEMRSSEHPVASERGRRGWTW